MRKHRCHKCGQRGPLRCGICGDHLCSEWTLWPEHQASPAHILPGEVTEEGGVLGRMAWAGDTGPCQQRSAALMAEQVWVRGASSTLKEMAEPRSTRQVRLPRTPPNHWEELKEVEFLPIWVQEGSHTVDGTYLYPQAGSGDGTWISRFRKN